MANIAKVVPSATQCQAPIKSLDEWKGSVRMVKNCDLGLENAARGRVQPANNIYICFKITNSPS